MRFIFAFAHIHIFLIDEEVEEDEDTREEPLQDRTQWAEEAESPEEQTGEQF